jgi:hypothetical protein
VLPHLTTGRFGLVNILNLPLTEVEACPDGYREERTLLSPQVTTKIQPHRGPCQLEVVKWLFDNRIFEKRLERKILLIKSMK